METRRNGRVRPEMANMGGEIYAGRERASVAKESGGVWAAAELAPRLSRVVSSVPEVEL